MAGWRRQSVAPPRRQDLARPHLCGWFWRAHHGGTHDSSLAWIPEASGRWVLPLCHEGMTRLETPASGAAFQRKQVTRQLPVRPLAVYDRGYGNASFVKQTAAIEADLLRLASNRCV